MTRRTLPSDFPVFRLADFYSGKAARASKLRVLAAAQNWLWANMIRYYAYSSFEGNGCIRVYGKTDPVDSVSTELPPSGASGAKLLSSFLVVPNWGPSATLEVYGRNFSVKYSVGFVGKMIAALYDLDGNYLGQEVSSTWSTGGAHDWSLELTIPQDRACMVKLWMAPTLGYFGSSATSDSDYAQYAMARYKAGVSTDLQSGDTAPTTWQPVALDYIKPNDNTSESSALLVTLAKNVLHLYTQRPPVVMSTYFGQHYWNTSTFTEVGRYKVKLSPLVTSIVGRFNVFCTHGGAGNEVRVLVDGVVKQTWTALAAGETTMNWTAITNLTNKTEITITVEAKSTAAGAHWGTIVHGVHAWEYDVTLNLPSGSSIPADYVPLDEDRLTAFATINEQDMIDLFKNNTWLAAARLKTLVQDWRHRTYKRIGGSGVGGDVEVGGDWTHGLDEIVGGRNMYTGHQKNISVFPQAAIADSLGSTAYEAKDGIGHWAYGESVAGWTTVTTWPPSADHQQYQHGDRLLEAVDSATQVNGTPLHLSMSDPAMTVVRAWVRAKRRRPFVVAAYDNGVSAANADGPGPEEEGFVNAGKVIGKVGSTQYLSLPVVGRGTRPDYEACWYGPDYLPGSVWGTLDLVGSLMSTRYTRNSVLQGLLFEMELNGALLIDAPLTQRMLNEL